MVVRQVLEADPETLRSKSFKRGSLDRAGLAGEELEKRAEIEKEQIEVGGFQAREFEANKAHLRLLVPTSDSP